MPQSNPTEPTKANGTGPKPVQVEDDLEPRAHTHNLYEVDRYIYFVQEGPAPVNPRDERLFDQEERDRYYAGIITWATLTSPPMYIICRLWGENREVSDGNTGPDVLYPMHQYRVVSVHQHQLLPDWEVRGPEDDQARVEEDRHQLNGTH